MRVHLLSVASLTTCSLQSSQLLHLSGVRHVSLVLLRHDRLRHGTLLYVRQVLQVLLLELALFDRTHTLLALITRSAGRQASISSFLVGPKIFATSLTANCVVSWLSTSYNDLTEGI